MTRQPHRLAALKRGGDARVIRMLAHEHISQTEIAKAFRMSIPTVNRIVLGRTYAEEKKS